jgi:drug/metabolite transporter (DMT)-like permease
MQWFFIALSAPFLWSLVNISDQYLVEKYAGSERSSGALVLFSSLIGILASVVIAFFVHNVFATPLIDKLLLIATGVLTILWVILYLFALEIEDVSAIVPWFLTVPIFGYVLGYLFLGETLSFTQQIGSVIILAGVTILFFDFSNKGISSPKWTVALYMVPACFMIAVMGVIFKYVTIADQFWNSSFWEYVGLGLTGILIYIFSPNYRREFKDMIRKGKGKIFSLNVGSEVTTIIGNLLTNFALLLAPVTMVYLVGSFQPAILLILTLFCTKFFPNIVKEDMSMRVLLPKILAIGVIIAGSVVLFI